MNLSRYEPFSSLIKYSCLLLQYNTIQMSSVNNSTRNVSWCQAYSSHIHANHKTSLNHNSEHQNNPSKTSFINKCTRNPILAWEIQFQCSLTPSAVRCRTGETTKPNIYTQTITSMCVCGWGGGGGAEGERKPKGNNCLEGVVAKNNNKIEKGFKGLTPFVTVAWVTLNPVSDCS